MGKRTRLALVFFYTLIIIAAVFLGAILNAFSGTKYLFLPAVFVALTIPAFYMLGRDGKAFLVTQMATACALPLLAFAMGTLLVVTY